MEYIATSCSPQDTHAIAQKVATSLPFGSVVVLEGMLGVGKTTFTQGFAKALGVKRAVKSPTYTIVKDYELSEGGLVHVDAYRLEEGGAETIDLHSYMTDDAIVLIEWANFVAEYLPKDYLMVSLEFQDVSARRIKIQSIGDNDAYHRVIEQLSHRTKVGE